MVSVGAAEYIRSFTVFVLDLNGIVADPKALVHQPVDFGDDLRSVLKVGFAQPDMTGQGDFV